MSFDKQKLISIGIPAFKAHSTIRNTLSSIQIQSLIDSITVIIANDNPGDNYDDIISCYPTVDIKYVDTDKNTGPGLARQRCIDNCDTPLITFIDADDILADGYSIEKLVDCMKSTNNCIMSQGSFLQEARIQNKLTFVAKSELNHPWVFGRLYNVEFLRKNDIKFSELRAMEDSEFNSKLRLLVEGSQLKINVTKDPVYIWKTGSDHSITRIGVDDNNIPQYNFDLCPLEGTQAHINAIKFARAKNPFNGNVNKFCVEIMIGQYFTYVECLGRKPIFAEQNLYNAKHFYNECYKDIENQIPLDTIKQMYTLYMASKANSLIGIIPEITFFDFMKLVKESEWNPDEIKEIRSRLPQDIIDNDIKCGVISGES